MEKRKKKNKKFKDSGPKILLKIDTIHKHIHKNTAILYKKKLYDNKYRKPHCLHESYKKKRNTKIFFTTLFFVHKLCPFHFPFFRIQKKAFLKAKFKK